jgi:N-acetylmuramoyl-L-alanine amidase
VGSPNFWHGRPNGPPIALVIHTMGGSLEGCDSWFGQSISQVSAHYGVGLEGSIHQYVRLGDRAWANGVLEPGNLWPGPDNVNPNDVTVSVETEDLGHASQEVTDAEYESTRYACQQALEAYPDIEWLLSHDDISPSSRPNCCGDRWKDSGRFHNLALALGLGTVS